MPGLFTALSTAADAMSVFEKALDTIGNNVNNSGTPGYAKQRLTLVPQLFDPALGLSGGVAAGGLESSRNEYLERSVWRNQQNFGLSDQLASELASVEPLFDVTGDAGIPNALNNLFQSFSALSVSPNDAVARQGVLNRAGELAAQFTNTSAGLSNIGVDLNERIQSTANTINSLASQIRELNVEIRGSSGSRANPAVDASMHNALESLAEYVDFVALPQPDGSISVLMGGQTPLVIGDKQYTMYADANSGTAVVGDSQGNDVTSQITGGRLKALIDMKNTVLPGFGSDLNRLAAAVSDGVNAVLAGGVDLAGNMGAPLFAYSTADDAAFSIHVTDIISDQIAAALPGAEGGNGNALNLTSLAMSPQIDGLNFTQFYGDLAGKVGQALSTAQQSQQTSQDLLVQARSLRADAQSVSLDEEAANLIEFQRAYQASARLVSVLNDLTQTTIDMLH